LTSPLRLTVAITISTAFSWIRKGKWPTVLIMTIPSLMMKISTLHRQTCLMRKLPRTIIIRRREEILEIAAAATEMLATAKMTSLTPGQKNLLTKNETTETMT
jgi:hypothetical protein